MSTDVDATASDSRVATESPSPRSVRWIRQLAPSEWVIQDIRRASELRMTP